MTTSLKIGNSSLSPQYKERLQTHLDINEKRKKEQQVKAEKIVADRAEEMKKNRQKYKEEIYRTQGKTPLVEA